MFKLLILFVTIFSTSFARPGYLQTPLVYTAPVIHHDYVKIHEPVVTKVGAIVESIPSAVSHQSQTVVHSKGHIVTPVLAPAVKTYVTPVLKTYAAPVWKTYSPFVYGYDHHHHHHH